MAPLSVVTSMRCFLLAVAASLAVVPTKSLQAPEGSMIRLAPHDFDRIFDGILPSGHSVPRRLARDIVATELKRAATREQKAIVKILSAHSIQHKAFWIVNAIHVKNLTSAAAVEIQQLADRMSIQLTIEPSKWVRRISPVDSASASSFTRSSKTASPDHSARDPVQWNIALVGADQVWSTANGSGVVVATMDGGVNYQHNLLVNGYRGTLPSGDFDHDYNWADFAYKNKEPLDTDGHGTNVQGIATATGGVGVAPGAKWISAKVFNWAGYSSDAWGIAGAQWVMCPTPVNKDGPTNCSLGADIVSCSWGEDDDHSPFLEQYVAAWEKAGILSVWAVGNSGPQCKTSVSPADYGGVIGVGGTDKTDSLLEYSSRGPANNGTDGPLPYDPLTPAIVAPGLFINGPSYKGSGGLKEFSGTSQACPHVAGAAALIMSAKPQIKAMDVRALILNNTNTAKLQAPDKGDHCGGIPWNTFPNYVYGHGRLDCAAAVKAAIQD